MMGFAPKIVPGADGPLIPPAFLEDEDDEGSEWGWTDWDGVDWRELRSMIQKS